MKINKSFLSFIVYGISSAFLFQGCMQYNVAYTPLVPDSGSQIITRNKYRINEVTIVCKNGERVPQEEFDPTFLKSITSSQTGVFSSEGVPVNVIIDDTQTEELNSWGKFTMFIPGMISAFTLPAVFGDEHCRLYQLTLNGGTLTESMKIREERTVALTMYSPIAWLVPMSDKYEVQPGYRTFHEHGRGSYHHIEYQALAYGIAVRLKEMEDAGLINTASGNPNVRFSMPLPVNSLIPSPTATIRPNPPVSAKPVIQRGGNAEVPARKETMSPAYEVENITFE